MWLDEPPGAIVREVGVADNEKSATVIERVAGWLVAPSSSATWNETVCVPGVAKITFALACVLELGLPVGNVQE